MKLVDIDTMGKCETCARNQNGKCSPSVWCENGEQYKPDFTKIETVELVHCKDCYYWMKAKVNRSGNLVCPKSGMEIIATDYCSKAERRKGK